LQTNPTLLDFSKWGIYLPNNYQVNLLKESYFDIEQTKKYIEVMKFCENKKTI
jgi:ATP-dependent helicase Lhr and Lhr-like helicase